MASKYARAVGGNWSTDATWSTTSGGAADTVAPTAADDVFLDASSGNVTHTGSPVCRSINCTGYTGTYDMATITLNIGDATAGASNIALKFVAGMTISNLGVFNFISTSATVQDVDFAGKTTGAVNFNASSNGSWKYTGSHTAAPTSTVTLTKGSLDTNGQTCSWGTFNSNNSNTRTITLGASTITLTGSGTSWNTSTATNLTWNKGTSTIIQSGDSPTLGGYFNQDFYNVSQTGHYGAALGLPFSFNNYSRIATSTTLGCTLALLSNMTITGTFTLTGFDSNKRRLLVYSNVVGTTRTWTNTGATQVWSDVDLQDIALTTTYDASARTDIGDCGGNSGITFPASVQQTWSGTSGGNWSANAWTTRVPLPQDDVVINAAFSSSQTLTVDMPRIGRSVDFSGVSGSNLTVQFSTAQSIFGSLTLSSAITNFTNSTAFTYAGRGNYTITSAGKGFGSTTTFACPGGTYTLQDSMGAQSNFALVFQAGGFDSNGFSFGVPVDISISGTLTKSITLGTSTVVLSRANAAVTLWNFATTTGLTFSGANSTIQITGSNNQTAIFAGGGLTYGVLSNTVSTSTGQFSITGANSFSRLDFSRSGGARTLAFTPATTTTIRTQNGFNVFGTVSGNITVASTSAANHTLTSSSQQAGNINYLTINNSVVDASPKWYAGANSTDGGTNTNWIFTAAPAVVSSSFSRTKALKNFQNLQRLG